jgi:hypothetical protein
MAQPEYKDIRDGDWQSLRQAVRRMNERLSDLEGFGGEKTRYANLKMDGNRLRNGPPNQKTAENDEFITRGYLDSPEAKLIVNPNEIGAITGSSSIGVSTDKPTTYSNFTDIKKWHRFNSDPTSARMTLSSGGVSISGIRAAAPICLDIFVGVSSEGRLFPSHDTGLLTIRCNFDSYVQPLNPTEDANNVLFGIMFAQDFPGFQSAGAQGVFGGLGQAGSAGGQRRFILSRNSNATTMQSISAQSSSLLITNGAKFSITFYFGAQSLLVGTSRSYGLKSVVFDGDNGISQETFASFGTDTSRPMGMLAFTKGVRVALGMWPQQGSMISSARLVSFQLIEGLMYW